MVYYNEQELCIIEMLAYFNKVGNVIYDSINVDEIKRKFFTEKEAKGCTSIGEILSEFTQDKLNILKESGH